MPYNSMTILYMLPVFKSMHFDCFPSLKCDELYVASVIVHTVLLNRLVSVCA